MFGPISHRSIESQVLTISPTSRPRRLSSMRSRPATLLRALLHAMVGGADQHMLAVPVHGAPSELRARHGSAVAVLHAEATARIGPCDVLELVTDDAAGAALDAALVREEHATVALRRVARRGTAVDALLPLALQADLMVDDADVSARRVDVVRVDAELAFEPDTIL